MVKGVGHIDEKIYQIVLRGPENKIIKVALRLSL
jgi:hypothetical protein